MRDIFKNDSPGMLKTWESKDSFPEMLFSTHSWDLNEQII